MPLRAIVVNRVLPDVFRDPGARIAATTLVEDAQVAAWLSEALHLRVSAETVRLTGATYLRRSTLAQREAREMQRLSRDVDVPDRARPALQRRGVGARGAGPHRQGALGPALLGPRVPGSALPGEQAHPRAVASDRPRTRRRRRGRWGRRAAPPRSRRAVTRRIASVIAGSAVLTRSW